MTAKLIFFAGSARAESINKKLANAACGYASSKGAEAEFIDLKDYPMPIYCGDLEDKEGLPDAAIALKEKLAACDGFFIASPEYNSGYSALLKNTIDWLTRPNPKTEEQLNAFKGKVAAISATSPGGLGGLRGLVPLRSLLGNIGIFVTPTQIAISNGFNAFDENGALSDERQKAMLEACVTELMNTATALKAS